MNKKIFLIFLSVFAFFSNFAFAANPGIPLGIGAATIYKGMAGDPCCKKTDCFEPLECKCNPDAKNCKVEPDANSGFFKVEGKSGICAFEKTEPVCPFGPSSISSVIENITKWVFYLTVIIAPLLVVYGAFLMLTSTGDPEKAGKAKKIILWAIVGLSVILFSRGILSLVSKIIGTY